MSHLHIMLQRNNDHGQVSIQLQTVAVEDEKVLWGAEVVTPLWPTEPEASHQFSF